MSKEIIQTVIQRKKSEEIKQTKWSKIYVVGSQKEEKEWNRRNRWGDDGWEFAKKNDTTKDVSEKFKEVQAG